MSTTDAREGTASATRTVASVIGGRTLEDAPGGTVSSVNPARKDEAVAEVLLGDAGTFVEACRAARGAQGNWAAVPAPIRAQVIKKVGRIVERNKEALARLVTREVGKPYVESLGEVQEIVDTCDFFTGEGRRLYGQTVPSEMLEARRVLPRRRRRPRQALPGRRPPRRRPERRPVRGPGGLRGPGRSARCGPRGQGRLHGLV
jgi:aldehyde dehydrogenase (NAD+)